MTPLDTSRSMVDMPKRGSQAEKDYFAFIASMPCAVTGRYGVQVAHFRSTDSYFHKPITGTGIKPRVPYVLPLTPAMHDEQEGMNEWEFWIRHGFQKDPVQKSPLALCWTLWRLYHADADRTAEAVIRNWRNT